MNLLQGYRCLTTLTSAEILTNFLSKFTINKHIIPIMKLQDYTCIANFPGYFAHMPFRYQIQGIPFKTEREAQDFLKIKIQWALDAMKNWDQHDRDFHLKNGKVVDGIFQTSANNDAHVIYYFEPLRTMLAQHLAPKPEPLPEPTVDVTKLCSEIEASIAATHTKMLVKLTPVASLDFIQTIEASIAATHHKVLNKLTPVASQLPEPNVDVASFCRSIQEHIRATHDLMFSKFDYYAGGYHLQHNGWKMFAKIHAKRLKARACLNKMWANPKKRELIKQVASEIWKETCAETKLAALNRQVEDGLDDVYRLQSEMIEFNESRLGFSPPMVSMPSFKANVKELRMTAERASKQNRPKINEIIRLYEEKKIPNFLTAENAINRLALQSKNKARALRAEADYNKIIAKYGDAESITGRLTRQVKESQKDYLKRLRDEREYSLTMILFRKRQEDEPKPKPPTENMDPTARNVAELAQTVPTLMKQKSVADLVQFYIGTFNITLDKMDREYLGQVEDKMLRRGEGKRGGDVKGTRKENKTTASDFAKVANLLASKNVVFSNLMDMSGKSYLEAIYLMSIYEIAKEEEEHDPKKKKTKDGERISAYYRFTTTTLDLEASTFAEAISKSNYVKDECFLNSIYDFYRDSLLRSDKSRNVITRASILQTLGKTEQNVKDGLSIQDVLPFFEKHRLQLRVFNKFCKLEFKYDPPNRNHHNKTMYCMMTDGHIYTLNHDIDKLSHLDQEHSDSYTPHVSDCYQTKEDAEPRQARMISTIDDILQVVRDMGPAEKKGEKRILSLIHKEDDLMSLLNEFVKAGYSPGVNFEAGRVTALKLELNNIFCIIETQQLIKSAIDGVVVVDSEETYNAMNRAMVALNSKLFLKSHLSYYTEKDLDVLDSYRTKPICGNLTQRQDNVKLIEIDISKAYTSVFASITEIPIFNEFDVWRPYNNEPILPLCLYVVKGFSHALSTQSHTLVYGKFIQDTMQIVACKQPSFIKKVDYQKLVDELYETKIAEDERQDAYIKKQVANVNIGLLEKSYNRKQAGYIFQDYAECKFYQATYGGNIHCIQRIECIETELGQNPDGLDDGLDPVGTVVSCKYRGKDNLYYVLVLKAEKQLKNGFRYIKELLLQSHNFKLMQAYDALTEANVKITSVKTDCFTIPAESEVKARELLKFDQGVGSWRLSKTSGIIFPFENLTCTKLEDIELSPLQTNTIAVSNEWDVSELCDHFEKHRRVMVRAQFAGCGKSHACKAMESRGHNVLFVCPTNKLAQNNKDKGVTLNSFFGIGMSEDVTKKISKFDDSGFDVIVFDEIYFANVRMLARIRSYAKNNPGKIILATGDTNQLETIDLVSDQLNYEAYMDQCIDSIFPNNIMLQENKRLTSEADKQTLRQFKADIFDESIPVVRIIRKYFRFTNTVETSSNIAYKNSTCERVATTVREMQSREDEYEVGEVLVCRRYYRPKGYGRCHVNFEYTIDEVRDDGLVLSEGSNSFELSLDVVRKHFIHNYCRTCHSFQGSSISDKITIFDWRFFFVNRKWIYTAVTRATELSNVVFFEGGCDEIDDVLLDRYLDRKVDNYRKQDIKHNREVTDNFVTKGWLKAQFGRVCQDCGDCLRFDIVGGRVDSNLTADRIDNDECHHLNNIVPLCVSCNQRKSCW